MQQFLYHSDSPGIMRQLTELALDLRWTWSHIGDRLWRSISPEIWDRTQNPWFILQSLSSIELEKLTENSEFMEELKRLIDVQREYSIRPGWFKQTYSEKALNPVAYFSMEFGVGEALPLYAGGLGILAGDYLKTASDLHVPLIGIGLLYQEGYFRQIVSTDGWQTETYPYNEPMSLPVQPAIDKSGGWLRISLELPGRILLLRVWQVKLGSIMLYLLDSNDPLNSPADRGIINKLYDHRPEVRLMQEMILGIGGWRVLVALGIQTEVCHLNEGHAAFVVLERARTFMQNSETSFEVALCATRAGNIFTTHTPVAAGFDIFSSNLISHYLSDYLKSAGLSTDQLLPLARVDPESKEEPFNMAYLAMRGSLNINGVSMLHGKVSRHIFQPLFPRWPEEDIPISHITNGIHVPSWDSEAADELWTKAYGKGRWLHTLDNVPETIQQISDAELWAFRTRESQNLIQIVRQRMAYQLKLHGADDNKLKKVQSVFDSDALIMGFARRFTAYKRPNLLLTDPDRLIAILNNPKHPVQLVIAGKAHPDDEEGKWLVQQFINFTAMDSVHKRVVFLEDYDIAIAQELVQGVDLWLNTPRRPWEACGTSGMKVLVNGGLNISELDGWWANAYTPEVGWALGDGQEHPESSWDIAEANQLYDLLENEIIPEFYNRDENGIPVRWVARMRTSMSQLAPRFSSNRMLREYVDNIYVPATNGYRNRSANNAQVAREMCDWRNLIKKYWSELHFGEIQIELKNKRWTFQVPVYFGELNPSSVNIQLYAGPLNGEETIQISMTRGKKIPGVSNGYMYKAEINDTLPADYFTPRIIPAYPDVRIPLEDQHILWQK